MRFIKSIIITLLSLTIYLSATIDVGYNTASDIGGFQFNVNDASILNASGGDAEQNGFFISTSSISEDKLS